MNLVEKHNVKITQNVQEYIEDHRFTISLG